MKVKRDPMRARARAVQEPTAYDVERALDPMRARARAVQHPNQHFE
jgi:hypothetical protein